MKQLEENMAAGQDKVDIREQLVNGGSLGTVVEIQVPEDAVARIRGILLDIDCYNFKKSWLIPDPAISPQEFYERHLSKWLNNHPVLRKAQVRCSGGGLHVLLMLAKPIELYDQLDRRRWRERVKIIQAVLPIDPCQPGIIAMTRPVGSINGKNNVEVTLLREGAGITEKELLDLAQQMIRSPFATVFKVLTGNTRVSPCPICGEECSLAAKDHAGTCYNCNVVGIDTLWNTLLESSQFEKGGSDDV